MAAEREAERREAEEILRKAEEAKKILAALNREEEMQRMGNNDTHRLSAAMRKRQRATEDESSEGERFDFDAMEVDESESEREPEVIKKVSQLNIKTTGISYQALLTGDQGKVEGEERWGARRHRCHDEGPASWR